MTMQQTSNIEWVDIGMEGLDKFIPGIPKGDAILVRGEPGTGKTISCLQFLYKGAKNGEKCLYITTEETPETVMRTGGELWSDFPKLIQNGTIKVVNLSITASYASEYCLVDKNEAMDIVQKGLKAQPGAVRIVIDSLSSLARRLSDSKEFRQVFMKILMETKAQGATTLFSAEGIPVAPGITEYLVDHLIYLDYRKHDVVWTRVFLMKKARSIPMVPQVLKLNIKAGGLSVEEIPFSLKPVWFGSE
jgi:KaiC/GvpD/RAD55 family RecA-like ATPase